jgi:hypothetical protein
MDRSSNKKPKRRKRKLPVIVASKTGKGNKVSTSYSSTVTNERIVAQQPSRQSKIPVPSNSTHISLHQKNDIIITKKKKAVETVAKISISANSIYSGKDDDDEQLYIVHRLPPPFPSNLKRPENGFLRDEEAYKKSFKVALQTSYEGFVVDTNVVPNENEIQATLQTNMQQFFITDITQPFGLGTACTPTYVTRCLMGDPGTTYKYLGLRMFAHPWNETIRQVNDHLSSRVTHSHLPNLYRHRQSTSSTSDMDSQSLVHYQSNTTKKSRFDICLINRMMKHENLKTEPLDKRNKITVSWHADSSLEHYSTIAVYQTLIHIDPIETVHQKSHSKNHQMASNDIKINEWSIGLRLLHNAEGPKCNSRNNNSNTSTDIGSNNDDESTTITSCPPIAISLPSNSAYYLLDDFNHHHQHTVMIQNNHLPSTTIRFSLTFRLLRESHNVNDIIDRCQRCIAQFHKKGTKVYRYEQLTLNEVESEWIRQFYIQGQHHYRILWDEWSKYFTILWNHWSSLETRTHQIVQFLQHAAEGRCLNSANINNVSSSMNPSVNESDVNNILGDVATPATTKIERKLRSKRKKAVVSMFELQQRENIVNNKSVSNDASGMLYETFASMLEERATMRELWAKREIEPVFKKIDMQFRPIPLPIMFNCTGIQNDDNDEKSESRHNNIKNIPSEPQQHQIIGVSPMPGTPNDLRKLATTIRVWGIAFQTGNPKDLPSVNLVDEHTMAVSSTTPNKSKTSISTTPKISGNDSGHIIDKSTIVQSDWDGWLLYKFGLEMQFPWSRKLIDGQKTIEIRRYDLPPSLIGQKIYIIETPAGVDGVSGITGNHFRINSVKVDQVDGLSTDIEGPKIVGWCIFPSVKQYTTQQTFCNDNEHHLVVEGSHYGWIKGESSILFGWIVSDCGHLSHRDTHFVSGVRRHRSLFQLTHSTDKPRQKRHNDVHAVSNVQVTKRKYKNKKNVVSGLRPNFKKHRF